MPFKALVIGGSGGMGRWFAGLLKRSGFDVSISSRRDACGMAMAMGVGCASRGDAGQFDMVILSVPVDAVADVATEVGPLMRPGSLLMDLSSLKKAPVAAMLEHAPLDVEVIGVHPLFGPGLETIEGRNVVLVPSGRHGRWLPVVREVFESAGATVSVATPEEHDRKMAVVQGLTHLMYLGWGRAMEQLGVRPGDLEGYETPVYGITRDLAGRVLSQSPELYAQIQAGDQVPRARAAYLRACSELASMAEAGDLGALAEAFRSAAAHYGDTGGAWRRTERLICMDMPVSASIRASLGEERAFLLPGGRQAYGIVKEATREGFTLETPSETLVLRYDQVTLLGPEWLGRLKGGSPRISRDILVKLPIGADAMVLRQVLSRIDGVSGVEAETHDAPSPDHVVCRFTIDVSPGRSEETLQRVLATIWGLGLEVK